ncbi:DUF6112 family protein [Propionibacterium freudenreichii]|uniref:DUF6112 family protein n=1 Tax=Propionibacterium freudenreichii TaxID=1744 RepID=UPI00255179AB|nr:DUF6112 family protein [Propionibacterium freudenreichii]
MNIYPDFDALGDNTTLHNVIGALLTFVLVTAVLTMLISGITWAIATANGNHTTATKAALQDPGCSRGLNPPVSRRLRSR